MPEPIISKKGKGGYAFYSDKLTISNDDAVIKEIFHSEIHHIRYSSKFNLIGIFWILGQSPRVVDVPPIRKNVMEIILKDGRPSLTIKLAHNFERIKEIINVPTKTDWQPLLDPGGAVYRSRHSIFSYAVLTVAAAILVILSAAAFMYDNSLIFILGVIASTLLFVAATWIREEDYGKYSTDDRSLSMNSLFRSERIYYPAIRSIKIIHSKNGWRKTPFVKHVVITFSKRSGRNIFRDAELKIFPRDAESLIAALRTKLPDIQMNIAGQSSDF